MAQQNLRIDDKELQKLLKVTEDTLGGDVRPIWREFAQYMRAVTDNTFQALRHGGSHRGVTWKYFSPQYTRKTDGVQVPAWGGVPKVSGKGVVKGRKRPSGARVSSGDSIVQASGVLRSRAALTVKMTKDRLILGPKGVALQYAGYQQKHRPFLFFTATDARELVNIAVKRLKNGYNKI